MEVQEPRPQQTSVAQHKPWTPIPHPCKFAKFNLFVSFLGKCRTRIPKSSKLAPAYRKCAETTGSGVSKKMPGSVPQCQKGVMHTSNNTFGTLFWMEFPETPCDTPLDTHIFGHTLRDTPGHFWREGPKTCSGAGVCKIRIKQILQQSMPRMKQILQQFMPDMIGRAGCGTMEMSLLPRSHPFARSSQNSRSSLVVRGEILCRKHGNLLIIIGCQSEFLCRKHQNAPKEQGKASVRETVSKKVCLESPFGPLPSRSYLANCEKPWVQSLNLSRNVAVHSPTCLDDHFSVCPLKRPFSAPQTGSNSCCAFPNQKSGKFRGPLLSQEHVSSCLHSVLRESCQLFIGSEFAQPLPPRVIQHRHHLGESADPQQSPAKHSKRSPQI